MPISYELASYSSMRFPGVQHQVSQFVLTLCQLPNQCDATHGQIGNAAAAEGGEMVYVVSDIYYPTIEFGAINLLWQAKYYRMFFGLPAKVGREKAYIAMQLTEISAVVAMSRSDAEQQATKQINSQKPNALTVAHTRPRANDYLSPRSGLIPPKGNDYLSAKSALLPPKSNDYLSAKSVIIPPQSNYLSAKSIVPSGPPT